MPFVQVEVKVIDLGMARLVEGECVYTDDILGTEGYHAPEVLFDDNYDFRADIFVLGITFCVMVGKIWSAFKIFCYFSYDQTWSEFLYWFCFNGAYFKLNVFLITFQFAVEATSSFVIEEVDFVADTEKNSRCKA